MEQEGAQHPWLAWQLDQRGSRVPGPEAKLRRLQASYYGLMSEVDDNLGRLFTHLKNVDAWHQTIGTRCSSMPSGCCPGACGTRTRP